MARWELRPPGLAPLGQYEAFWFYAPRVRKIVMVKMEIKVISSIAKSAGSFSFFGDDSSHLPEIVWLIQP